MILFIIRVYSVFSMIVNVIGLFSVMFLLSPYPTSGINPDPAEYDMHWRSL